MSEDPKPIREVVSLLKEWDQYDWDLDNFEEELNDARRVLLKERGCRLGSLKIEIAAACGDEGDNAVATLQVVGIRLETDQEAAARVKRMKAENRAEAKKHAKSRAEWKRVQEKRERSQYERLKKKFG